MNDNELANFWNQQVPDKFKHYIGSDFDQKKDIYVNQVSKELLSNIPLNSFSKNDVIIDWGVGGGLFSNILSNYGQLIGLDIAQTSLDKAKSHLQQNDRAYHQAILINELSSLHDLLTLNVKLIFSVSVIQHFVSIKYWEEIVSLWNIISPEYLAIQTRHGKTNEDHPETYFDSEKNYILGLKLTTDEVVNSFSKQYNVIYHNLLDDNHSMYEYFLFSKK